MSATAPASSSREAGMLIGGRWTSGADRMVIRNPAKTSEIVGSVPRGTPSYAGAAVEAAAAAYPAWSSVTIRERAQLLRKAAEALTAGEDERARLLSRENGQLLAEAQAGVRGCARTLSYYADIGEAIGLQEDLPTAAGKVFVAKRSMGVAVLIVPWNAPTRLAFLGLAPILLAGNTLVIKPPSEAPLALIDSIAAIHDIFPPGVVNVVTGAGDVVGDALIRHPAVRKVNFTGSIEAGKQILAGAADSVKRVSLELGGNDPAIVLADADLDRAVPELVGGVFGLSGQMCYNVKRIYVDRSLYPDLVRLFTDAADQLVVGNGLDPSATMGSLISERQRQRIVRLVEDASSRGGVVKVVGRKLNEAEWDDGYFQLPVVVTGVDEQAELVAKEQFGPAIPLLPFDSLEEAITLANATEYGLAASLWTSDEDRAFDLAPKLQAGTVFVNVHRLGASGDDMPFGGFKESGLGRSHGIVALEEQFEWQTVSSRPLRR